MKSNNIRFVWIIAMVIVLSVAVSIITNSITGNVIKARTSFVGTEVYTATEVNDLLLSVNNRLTALEGSGVTSEGTSTGTSTGQLECVTGYYDEIPGTGAGDATYSGGIYTSSLGKTYAFADVFTTRLDYWGIYAATVLTCKTGWILTGCSGAEGDNNDEYMINSNDCRSDYGSWATAYARCCRIA